tara:strand:- start:882 stop:1745 length:864 start_codon:yes stop_codon:yes gene_type:complete
MILTADVSTSAGLDRYRKKYSEKYLDVGIAEQNMIGIAAGLSSEGFNVITTTFAPFQTMRCLEQIKVNLGYMKNKVIMVGLASGIVLGSLGYTHCSIEDLSIMRSIPNITVISPADCLETAKSIESAINHEQSVYIRLTGSSNSPCVYKEDYDFKIGKVVNILNGEDVVILATGTMVYNSIEAANILKNYNIFPAIVNVHTLNHIDKDEIKKITNNAKIVFTLEEHSIIGGLSSFYSELRSSEDITSRHISIALPNNYNISGEYEYLKALNLLTPEKIANRIKNELR